MDLRNRIKSMLQQRIQQEEQLGSGLVGGKVHRKRMPKNMSEEGGFIKFHKTGAKKGLPYSTLLKTDGSVRKNIKHQDVENDRAALRALLNKAQRKKGRSAHELMPSERASLYKLEHKVVRKEPSAWNIFVKAVGSLAKQRGNNIPFGQLTSLLVDTYNEYKDQNGGHALKPHQITQEMIEEAYDMLPKYRA